jgi:hypothetical protein
MSSLTILQKITQKPTSNIEAGFDHPPHNHSSISIRPTLSQYKFIMGCGGSKPSYAPLDEKPILNPYYNPTPTPNPPTPNPPIPTHLRIPQRKGTQANRMWQCYKCLQPNARSGRPGGSYCTKDVCRRREGVQHKMCGGCWQITV